LKHIGAIQMMKWPWQSWQCDIGDVELVVTWQCELDDVDLATSPSGLGQLVKWMWIWQNYWSKLSIWQIS
jgi:hypothetical protein